MHVIQSAEETRVRLCEAKFGICSWRVLRCEISTLLIAASDPWRRCPHPARPSPHQAACQPRQKSRPCLRRCNQHKCILERSLADIGWRVPEFLDAVRAARDMCFDSVARVNIARFTAAMSKPAEGGHHAAITRPAGPDTNDTKSMAKRHRHDTDRSYHWGCDTR